MNDNRRPTLAAMLWPQQTASRIARFAALAIGGALALALSAKAQVPFYPVPMTLQTLVVLALGAAFGARLAAATVLLYLAEGLMGLQVFAGLSAGPAYMAGPTGGYLLGFLVAAALVGWLAERGWDRSLSRLLAVMVLGHLVIFAFGFAWLAVLVGPEKAWLGGIVPFVAATVLKTLLAWALVAAAWRAVASLRGPAA
ncbi:biotin transporter BioY [Methylocapsa sp. S129]|uniref:biotin transporter BioY n=1 Tax=Methylocapsa sp. S129 TaxID=1641869 RepID=UPI001FEE7A65|nr:biotin transporter BioY [Methylocapsa sp. S129]